MDKNKCRRVLAIVALAFMAIFTVTFVVTLVSPKILNGAIAIVALISGLLGIGLFLVVRFALTDKADRSYLPPDEPKPDENAADETQSDEATANDAALPEEKTDGE